ncbi:MULTISPECIES: type II toxin-antitoxin system Phd/YefM family antitoxin [unclassified Fusibacter]|uniref:type II toxin-antitoxin system Phd/YefM family antitoxin n=1 Tax=unclassified Fusibacter TaxID=2624464 RepID=UPI001011E4C6|nr:MULTISPECIES: type II toxin-antitoxin system Phd/YefM family antitoxin [unclassified Fusibacter]MCK8059036.1 type II toxin-antitoxin system Phd/YefM family antitoxin [Fusibacter sp. A2]NPE22447.1 type II toxin-antitoxin system Phd/YefM family antitoxin [Fusibacter sp. A1]RXV60551.1 type II toxin-antitoxin system Phd/YefM family antitoxin [Fusibacter sp. A1]
MITLSVTNFRKNIYNILSQAIKFNEPININTKEGNAVILSEEDYNGLIETLNLSNIPNLKESIIEGLNTPIDECVSEEEVEW